MAPKRKSQDGDEVKASKKASKKSFKGSTRDDLTWAKFDEAAGPVTVSFDYGDEHLYDIKLSPSKFKSGSWGWKGDANFHINILGKELPVKVNLNLIVAGSKKSVDDSNKSRAKKADESSNDANESGAAEEDEEDEEEKTPPKKASKKSSKK